MSRKERIDKIGYIYEQGECFFDDWNRPNMMISEFIDKIQKFSLEKNIGIEIEVVDGEKVDYEKPNFRI